MGKYHELAKDIVKNVGGKENISGLTHCVTRLRFKLKNEAKANDDVIKNLDGVVTLMKSAGQYQVVIGNHVPEVYDDVCDVAGIVGDMSSSVEEPKLSIGAKIIDFISGVMGPALAVLMASGMIKGILAIFEFAKWIDTTGGLYALLSGVGDAMFYFFPVIIGYNAAKKLKMDPFVGLLIGAGLMYPTLQGVDLNIIGYTINVTYTSSVLPVVLTTIFASFIYKGCNKIIPDVIKTFVVPMFTLIIAVPLGFVVIGPAANAASNGIADIIMSAYNMSPILAGLLMGGLWQILVVFGIHMGLVAVGIMQMMSGQPTPIFSLSGTANYAQVAVVMAIWIKTKNKKLKNIALPAWISGVFGVTEPAIYGVTLPRMKFFIISCIGAALGGAYTGFSGLLVYQMAGLGIFAIPGLFGGAMSIPTILLHFSISVVIAMGFSFIATFMLYKDEETIVKSLDTSHTTRGLSDIVFSPMKGSLLPLHQAHDQAFALGTLGKGVVIEPSEGIVYAPVDGTITTLFPTLHAIGITSDSGIEILIHIGSNTVQLEGKGFTPHIKQGDHVHKGQILMEFDMKTIQASGCDLQTPIIITNSKDMMDIVETSEVQVNEHDDLITVLF